MTPDPAENKWDATLPGGHLDQCFTLPDGRKLSYAEFGDPTGYPVIYFHGFPGCRLEPWPHQRMRARKRIRLICPDRPGIGGSSPLPGRRYLDYPPDVLHLADHLGLRRFAILGVSGGAPYAVACAKAIPPERMSAVGLLAPAAPWHVQGEGDHVTRYLAGVSRLGAWAVRRVPSIVESIMKLVIAVLGWLLNKQWVISRIDWWLERSDKNSLPSEEHKDEVRPDEPLSGLERREQLLGVFHEQFKQGTQAVMDEAKLLLEPWGYDLCDVSYDPIQIWHGSKDVNAPVQQSRLMASKFPHVEMKEFDLDHPQMLAELGMVLDELVTDGMRLGE